MRCVECQASALAMLQWYASFEVARVGILASHGFNASVGQFSTGTPDITQPAIMNAFASAIDAVLKHGGVLNGKCNRAGGRAGAGVGGGATPAEDVARSA